MAKEKEREEAKELPVDGMWAGDTPGLPFCLLQKEPWEIKLFQKEIHSYLCKQGDILLCGLIST